MTSDHRPENLYDLCNLSAEAITSRPLNYYQSSWAIEAKSLNRTTKKEACGTAFCRAGWMVALSEPAGRLLLADYIANKARTMFTDAGIPLEDINALFDGGAIETELDCEFDGDEFLGMPDVGTQEYAEAGAAGLRAFMAKHADKLKAAPIKVED